jgi:hypothetical protein
VLAGVSGLIAPGVILWSLRSCCGASIRCWHCFLAYREAVGGCYADALAGRTLDAVIQIT